MINYKSTIIIDYLYKNYSKKLLCTKARDMQQHRIDVRKVRSAGEKKYFIKNLCANIGRFQLVYKISRVLIKKFLLE